MKLTDAGTKPDQRVYIYFLHKHVKLCYVIFCDQDMYCMCVRGTCDSPKINLLVLSGGQTT